MSELFAVVRKSRNSLSSQLIPLLVSQRRGFLNLIRGLIQQQPAREMPTAALLPCH
jgi:hypothetical protein